MKKQIYKKRTHKLLDKYIINPYQFIEDPEDPKADKYSNDFEEAVGYDIYDSDPQNDQPINLGAIVVGYNGRNSYNKNKYQIVFIWTQYNRKLWDPIRLLFSKLKDYLEENYERGLFDSDKDLFNFIANFIENDGYIE